VDGQLNAKLADLELGHNSAEQSRHQESSESLLLNWAAPEVLQGDVYTQAADVYALGLVLWEIFSGEAPYNQETNSDDSSGQQRMRAQVGSLFRLSLFVSDYHSCVAVLADLEQHSLPADPPDLSSCLR
jgi:serine/threonine protein kinase